MSIHELNKANVSVRFPENADRFADLPVIYTKRLIICPMTLFDVQDDSNGVVPGLWNVRRHHYVMRWSRVGQPDASLEQSRDWAVARQEAFLQSPPFVIQLAAEDGTRTTIGSTGVVSAGAEIGYMLNPDYENKGYGTEAIRGLITAFWEFMPATSESSTLTEHQRKPYDYVEAMFEVINAPSRNLLRKCGLSKVKDYYDDTHGDTRRAEIWRLARPGTVLAADQADQDAGITAGA